MCRAASLLAVGWLAFAVSVPAPAAEGRFGVEFEAGPAWQSKNDVQIPNDADGTRFSLRDMVGSGPWVAPRLYFSWDVADRHGLRLLLAPLSYTESGAFDGPVEFAGGSFAAGVPTRATYRFDSWRVTYRYRFHDGERWRWWIGFTAKVRDAEIRLEQDGAAAEDTDVGFVPLLHLAGDWRFSERWRFRLDLDALAGGPGRAEDLSLKLAYDVDDRWTVSGGYRTVEGGADVDDVYSFAWFHYAVASAAVRF